MLRKSDGLRCSDNYLDGLIKNTNSLSASRRRVKAGEITLTLEVCAGNGCKLSLQTLLYQTYNMQDEMKMTSNIVPSEIQWYKNTRASFWFLNVHYVLMFIQQSLLEKCWYCGSPQINKCMYVKHIPQHNNLSPTSLLITLTVFVAGATNSPIYKHRPEVTFGPGACADETVYSGKKILYTFHIFFTPRSKVSFKNWSLNVSLE